MVSLKSAIKVLGVGIAIVAMATGCATAKKGEMAEAAAAASTTETAAAAESMAKEEAMAADMYTVVSGDTLWGISEKADIYGNPYEWPGLWRGNFWIVDPDAIQPKDKLAVPRDLTAAQVAANIKHAKTRGTWLWNVIEETDTAFKGCVEAGAC